MSGGEDLFRRKAVTIMCVACILISFARLFFAAELTDESSSIAQEFIFPQTGRLFEADLFVQSAPAAVIAPLVELYKRTLGVEGFVLFTRFVYFAWAALAAWASFLFLQRHFRRDLSAIIACVPMCFYPFSITGWTYNNVGMCGTVIGISFLMLRSSWAAAFSALAICVTCFSYPPLTFLFAVVIPWYFFRSRAPLVQRLIFLGVFLLGCGVVASLVLGAGRDNIHRVIEFTKAFEWVGGWKKVSKIFLHLGYALSRSGLVVVLGVLWWTRKRAGRLAPGKNDSWFLIGCVLLTLFSGMKTQQTMGFMVYAPIAMLAFFLIGRLRWSAEFLKGFEVRLALGFGFGAALITGYFSSNMVMNAALGMIIPLQILGLESARALESSGKVSTKWAPRFLLMILMILAIGNYRYIYRDEPIYRLTSRIAEGPFKGVFSHQDRAQMLTELYRDISKASQGRTSIFAAYLAPAYYQADLKPLTGMLFLHDGVIWTDETMRLALYHTIDLGIWPDIVVSRKEEGHLDGNRFEDFFKSGQPYEVFADNQWYRILVRQGAEK
ncbi:MAG: hypothetical protein AB7F86_10650 [Bdellovibrionales bacterium]